MVLNFMGYVDSDTVPFLTDFSIMTLTQLMYIVAVNKYRHFGTAAEKSFVTQPTLSMQVQKLEDELGLKIFDRSKSPVVPTPIGIEIIRKAEQILAGEKEIEDIARSSGEHLQGTYRIGIVSTVAPYLLPLFLKSFLTSHPGVSLIFEEGLTRELVQGIADDRLDAGIIASPPDLPQIFEKELFYEPFVGYIGKHYPLFDHERIQIRELNPDDLLLLKEGHCFRDQAEKVCAMVSRETQGPIQFSSGNLETLKRLVEEEYGITLLPWLSVHGKSAQPSEETPSARVIPFNEPEPCRKVRLIYSRKHLENTLIQALQEAILGQLPEALLHSQKRLVIE